MTREAILAIIEAHARQVLPDLPTPFDFSKPFTDYGATSLDTTVILYSAIKDMGIKITQAELASVDTVDDLVALVQRSQ